MATVGAGMPSLGGLESGFDRVLECAPFSALVTDTAGTIVYINSAFETGTGYAREEVLGSNPRFLKSGEHKAEFYASLWHTLEMGEVWRGAITNRTKGGQHRVEDTVIFPVRNEGGRIVFYVSIAEQTTRDAEFEAQLRQSQKMEAIGQLAAGIAHEINTPTQYIGDNIQFFQESMGGLFDLLNQYDVLVRTVEDGGEVRELIAAIRSMQDAIDLPFLLEETPGAIERTLEGNRRVAEVVRAMKEFAHPSAEEIAPVDLNRAIKSTIAVCRNEWKYVAELESRLDPQLPLVPCLAGAFNQVMLNLLVNAAHAVQEAVGERSGAKGKIVVETKTAGDWAVISIADTGGGIPEALREKVYNPFFTTKALGKGTGQGLAIVRSVIEETHGGSIGFETETGKGTTFTIRLPLNRDTNGSNGTGRND